MKKELIVKNISNVEKEYFKVFENKVNKLDSKIKFLIASIDYCIVLANKCSEVFSNEKFEKLVNEVSNYKENYTKETINKTLRGICSDMIEKICVFSDNAPEQIIGFILYHEIGHFLDYYNKTGKFKGFQLSSKKEFIEAYKKDLTLHWDIIKKDKRYRLIHLIQDSTPNNPNKIAMAETFANCFAKTMNEVDEFDFIGLYFKNTLQITEKIIQEFLSATK